jgi:hypothetical protein
MIRSRLIGKMARVPHFSRLLQEVGLLVLDKEWQAVTKKAARWKAAAPPDSRLESRRKTFPNGLARIFSLATIWLDFRHKRK